MIPFTSCDGFECIEMIDNKLKHGAASLTHSKNLSVATKFVSETVPRSDKSEGFTVHLPGRQVVSCQTSNGNKLLRVPLVIQTLDWSQEDGRIL